MTIRLAKARCRARLIGTAAIVTIACRLAGNSLLLAACRPSLMEACQQGLFLPSQHHDHCRPQTPRSARPNAASDRSRNRPRQHRRSYLPPHRRHRLPASPVHSVPDIAKTLRDRSISPELQRPRPPVLKRRWEATRPSISRSPTTPFSPQGYADAAALEGYTPGTGWRQFDYASVPRIPAKSRSTALSQLGPTVRTTHGRGNMGARGYASPTGPRRETDDRLRTPGRQGPWDHDGHTGRQP